MPVREAIFFDGLARRYGKLPSEIRDNMTVMDRHCATVGMLYDKALSMR